MNPSSIHSGSRVAGKASEEIGRESSTPLNLLPAFHMDLDMDMG